ncbi:hypothetical protein JA1_001700 [Spathaspora sp. JA1]|nr:hypothetical protein JA1_001700 [Spathaspora sp. JA1]
MIIHTRSTGKLVLAPQTLLLLTRLLSKGKTPENIVLAEALNLLQRSKDQEKRPPDVGYKPSLYDNIVKGPAQEQYHNLVRAPKLGQHSDEQRVSDRFISNLLSGIKFSQMGNVAETVNFADLYNMNPRELTLYIKSVKSEQKLFKIIETFYYNDRLTFGILSTIILNKALVNIDKVPIDLANIETDRLLNFDQLARVKFNIILLRKYHVLHQPLTVLRNLKQNFNDVYLPYIKNNKLPPLFERIVWKYTFEYLKQFDELHYLKEIQSIKSSFLILETTTKRNAAVAQYMLDTYHDSLTELQTIYLKLFINPYVVQCIEKELESSSKSDILISLQKLSFKHKICTLNKISSDQWSRRSCYALVADLEQFISKHIKLSSDSDLERLGNELKIYHMKVITNNQDKEIESREALEDFYNLVHAE